MVMLNNQEGIRIETYQVIGHTWDILYWLVVQ